jgi:ABC-type lipoprotein export system ATPase subunit
MATPNPKPVSALDEQAIIQMDGVVKTFKNAAGEFTVLKGVDLKIYPGQFVSIVGKSGSGKSTLLNMITGIDHPTAGIVTVAGTKIHQMSESQRSLWRGSHLGIVFQFFQLLPMLSLLENVMLPMDYVGLYDFDERPKRAMDLLAMVDLDKQAHKLPTAVSTGQQQSAAIARALANDPPVLVADEPTGNLDSRSADRIIALFEQLVEGKKTIVMVTHDSSLTMRTKRNVIISDGELIDESVARALPLLNHRLMLDVTNQAERLVFNPNQTIIQRDQHVEKFFIIVRGKVEVILQGRRREDVVVTQLDAGEFFGEIELMRGGKSIASIRCAPDGPVELLALPREKFLQLVKDSPMTEEAIYKIVKHRLDEHRAVDRRRKLRLFG